MYNIEFQFQFEFGSMTKALQYKYRGHVNVVAITTFNANDKDAIIEGEEMISFIVEYLWSDEWNVYEYI